MILAQLYFVLGWLLLVGGVVGIVAGFAIHLPYMPQSIGSLFAGLVCLGFAEICEAIAKVSENMSKTVALLEAIREALANTDKLRSREAESMRDLLVKVAISAPAIVPAAAPVAEKPVMFHYSNDDSTIRGPFSIEAMRAMIRDGVIRVDTPVALEGSDEWQTYSVYPELV